jgi:hypothetical protein
MLRSLFRRRHRRTALPRKNLSYLTWRYVGNAKRTWQARFSKQDYPEARQLGRDLQVPGILCGASSYYLSEDGQSALAEASKLVSSFANAAMANVSGPQAGKRKSYLVELVRGDSIHEADSPLLKVALDTKLLEIVASYLELWPSLYSIGAWLNYSIGEPPTSSQLWHRDPEDLKIIKVFIYLVDVDEQRGPFCYIPGTQSFGKYANLVPAHKHSMRITDEEMATAMGPEHWLKCTGPVGTMILADTVGFHRGGYVKDGHRVLITFTYTSGIPLKPRKAQVKERPTWLRAQIQKAAAPGPVLVRT